MLPVRLPVCSRLLAVKFLRDSKVIGEFLTEVRWMPLTSTLFKGQVYIHLYLEGLILSLIVLENKQGHIGQR